MAAIVAVAGTGIEQGVATEEARRVAARQQADVAHGVARRVEHLELHAAADRHHVAGAQAAVHLRNAALGVAMCQHPGSRSEERRVGKAWVRTCRSWGSPEI